MLEPVAAISSWHQVILALSVLIPLVGIFVPILLTNQIAHAVSGRTFPCS